MLLAFDPFICSSQRSPRPIFGISQNLRLIQPRGAFHGRNTRHPPASQFRLKKLIDPRYVFHAVLPCHGRYPVRRSATTLGFPKFGGRAERAE